MTEPKKTAASPKKTAVPKTTKPAEKKPAAKRAPAAKKTAASKTAQVSVIVEHHGRQISTDAIVDTAKKLWVMAGHNSADIAKVELYVKQEDGAVYCVVNGEAVGKYDL